MSKAWGWLASGLNSIALVFAIIAAVGVFAQMFATVYETIARYAFNSPTAWEVELSGYLLVLMTFLGAAQLYKEDGHIQLTFLIERFKNKSRTVLLLVIATLSLVCTSVYAWQSWNLVLRAHAQGRATPGLMQTPEWIPQLSVPIGMFVLSLMIIVRIVSLAQSLGKENKPTS